MPSSIPEDDLVKSEAGKADDSTAIDFDVGQIDPVEEKKVLRKIDRTVLPLMCTVYFFQYLDKQAVGYAALFHLAKDLGMSATDYSWTVSVFYLGQLVSELIFVYLMSRMPLSKFVGVMIMIWGVVAGCLAAPHTYAAFASVRCVLGLCEGAVSPAFVVVTSRWYKKSEHPIRIGAWVSCNGLASVVGALIMYGVGIADDVALANWRVMFLICGGATIACGAVFAFLMPLGPESAWFLTEAERKIAVVRLLGDGITHEDAEFSKAQLLEAARDPFCWGAVLVGFLGTFASPVLKFASLVINGFGWSSFNTMLVGLPSGALQFLFVWITVLGIRITKFPRCYWGIAVTVIPLVGNIGILAIPYENKWGVVVFTWLATIATPIMVVSLSLMASNIKGNTKKTTTSNVYFVAYGAAAIIAPQLWLTTESPRYRKGITADIICLSLIIFVYAGYRALVVRENKRRDALGESAGETMHGVAGLTDRQDLSIRYSS